MRCYFCGRTDFNHLDDISSHLATVTAQGTSVCKGLGIPLDPHGALELFPMKILGRKYAPKKMPKKGGKEDGVFMCLNSDGVISVPLVHELLTVKSPIGGTWDVGHYVVRNWLGFTHLQCFYCQKELDVNDTIDYCNWLCHFEDYFKVRKKAKRIDVYHK